MLANIAAVLWIAFDVVATLVTAPPLPLWYWRAVVYGGAAVAVFTFVVGLLDWMKQRRERKEDKEETRNLLQENREQIQEHFNKEVQNLRTDFAAIGRKLEPPEKKIEEMNRRVENWDPSMSSQQLIYAQQQARRQQMMRTRRRNLLAAAGAWVDAQKRSSEDDPKN
jgi:hypothetical protein